MAIHQSNAQCWETVKSCYDQTAALRSDGTIWNWGFNQGGLLGNGSQESNCIAPTQIGNDSDWKFVTVGAGFGFGIRTNGTLWAWGGNDYGQLGTGTTDNSLVPVQVGTDSDWEYVSAGFGNTKAIKTNGTLWSWGWNNAGVQGNGGWDNVLSPAQTGTDSDWKMVSVGDNCALALKNDGSLWSCGSNDVGQLGIGSTVDQHQFVQVGTNTNWNYIAISINAGMSTRCLATKTDGTLWYWGRNAFDIQDDYLTSPQQLGTESDWKEVGLGSQVTYMATKTNGTLWAWGLNTFGSTVGDGTTIDQTEPVLINNTASWSLPSTGLAHSTAIQNGVIYSWGANSHGQLGLGTTTMHYGTPQAMDSMNCSLHLNENKFSLEVYPNPVNGQLHLHISGSNPVDKIIITSISGQQVLLKEDVSTDIDVRTLVPGSYFIHVFSGNNEYQQLFIKE
ncbi:MAG: hypothetical protein A3D31_08800 [Candidatus Fluviicola riflensis]|nr:MAG: hypothetical protein A3D31_08800 [Candidatus Fluviicola riflensis]OGS82549.1 MAG: hypothetical protein A2724_17745 [Fluviicola sp. RIFCSPHIGHO2_01_FULL_43_53]OGS88213.1 MAG: hypothetical protein A3E30_15180 [Fluviicola sp. RIFCSPHIGHO2_12_FULL_43_24]